MILLLLAAAAAQPQGESARAFVERLYSYYRQKDYSPLRHPERTFTPRLVAALAEDARLSKGEVGYVDGDPICQCQDSEGVTGRVEKVTLRERNSARAQVLIGFPDSTPRRVRFTLARTFTGWRIADVSSPDEPSFLRGLEESNRKRRQKH